MMITRRSALTLSAGAATVFVFRGLSGVAHAGSAEAAAVLADFTGGVEPQTGRITLTAPELAENGNAVPIAFSVESAMQGDDMVETVLIVADGNPRADVVRFHFSELSGVAAATTRIRLAQSQTVIAVAKMTDGSFFADRAEISVAVGGCTG